MSKQNEKTKKTGVITFSITSLFLLMYIYFTSFLFEEEFRQNIFYLHIGEIYLYFLTMAVVLIFFGILLLYRLIINEHKSLLLLVIAIFIGGLSYFFGFLNFDPTGEMNFRQTRFFQFQIIFQTFSVFLLYLHYELNSRNQPQTRLISAVILSFSPYTVLNFYYLITDTYSSDPIILQFQAISLVLFQLGAIGIFAWMLINGINLSENLIRKEGKLRFLAGIQLSGMYMFFIGVILQSVEFLTPLDIWHTPLNAIALLLIGFSYFIDSSVMLFAPINIKLLGVVDNVGRTMYFRPIDPAFKDEKTVSTTSELFGALTLAFTSLGAEVAKADKGVDSLQFGDRSIIVEYIAPYYLVVIADRSTFFLQQEMEEYLKGLKNKYPQPPKDGSLPPKSFFASLDQRFFPTFFS